MSSRAHVGPPFDWEDGKGAVHAISLPEHRLLLRQKRSNAVLRETREGAYTYREGYIIDADGNQVPIDTVYVGPPKKRRPTLREFFAVEGPKRSISGRVLTDYDHALSAKRWTRIGCAMLAVMLLKDRL